MRVLVDENIPRMTAEGLRALGHDVKDIRGTSDQGAPDPDLWRLALAECRALVTTDKGFTEYRSAPHYGILIVPSDSRIGRRSTIPLCTSSGTFRRMNGRICSWLSGIPR